VQAGRRGHGRRQDPDEREHHDLDATSKSTNVFTIVKDATTGAITRTCTTPNKGSCPGNGQW